MLEQYGIHVLWFFMSCCFGTWMYFRGALKGTHAGVNAAIIFMTIHGRQKEAEDFIDFVNDLTAKKSRFDK